MVSNEWLQMWPEDCNFVFVVLYMSGCHLYLKNVLVLIGSNIFIIKSMQDICETYKVLLLTS